MRYIGIFLLTFYIQNLRAQTCDEIAPLPARFTEKYVEEKLSNGGTISYVHAAVIKENLIVISVKNPDPKVMFDTLEFPVTGFADEAAATVKNLQRHDKVCITGRLSRTHGKPISHLFINAIKVLKRSAVDARSYEYEKAVLEDLKTKHQIIAKVHISLSEGKVFVIEFRDRVIPIPVVNNNLTKDLYRGDKILLKYKIREHPNTPIHIAIDEEATEPLRVLASLKDQNGKNFRLQGPLVLYPKNSQTSQDVYAVQVTDADDIKYDYFILSENAQVFEEINLRAAKIWNLKKSDVKQGRNRLLLPTVEVRVEGRVQVVSRKQGNPQVAIENISQLEFLTTK